jgi:hypothetical protein
MPESTLHVLLSGLVVGEAPPWHENRLWCTDMGAGEVLAVDPAGKAEVVARTGGWMAVAGRWMDQLYQQRPYGKQA